jgi:hypothetical protein
LGISWHPHDFVSSWSNFENCPLEVELVDVHPEVRRDSQTQGRRLLDLVLSAELWLAESLLVLVDLSVATGRPMGRFAGLEVIGLAGFCGFLG